MKKYRNNIDFKDCEQVREGLLEIQKQRNTKESSDCSFYMQLWGESKLAKVACSGSLAPCFVNNDYVTAEIIYSTAHVHHKELAWTGATVCTMPV